MLFCWPRLGGQESRIEKILKFYPTFIRFVFLETKAPTKM